ncbi:unnamed protein product [Cyprideis torosa]|uniref:Uncharacterized protein n=1 Tax=Cyprideis torosa TaxID=163714 RepID=A0A7R8W496_9CRUS|nr:unnamed protein product [Cyprideis torosa]CAG0883951.1 unnamed protein product [Cyprideis torosa]
MSNYLEDTETPIGLGQESETGQASAEVRPRYKHLGAKSPVNAPNDASLRGSPNDASLRGSVHWLLGGYYPEMDFAATDLKIVQFIIICHFYWALALRILQRDRYLNWIIIPVLTLFLVYFVAVSALGIYHVEDPWIECLLGDEDLGCSGIFRHTQSIYSSILFVFEIVKYLVPVWILLIVLRPPPRRPRAALLAGMNYFEDEPDASIFRSTTYAHLLAPIYRSACLDHNARLPLGKAEADVNFYFLKCRGHMMFHFPILCLLGGDKAKLAHRSRNLTSEGEQRKATVGGDRRKFAFILSTMLKSEQ